MDAVTLNRAAGPYGVHVPNVTLTEGTPTWEPTCRWPGCRWTGARQRNFGLAAVEAGQHAGSHEVQS